MQIDSGSDVTTLSMEGWKDFLVAKEAELPMIEWGSGQGTLRAYAASQNLQIEASFEANLAILGK